MAKLDQIMSVMERTKDGCDHDCKECEMYLSEFGMCFHDAEKQRIAWNVKEKERFGRILKGEE